LRNVWVILNVSESGTVFLVFTTGSTCCI